MAFSDFVDATQKVVAADTIPMGSAKGKKNPPKWAGKDLVERNSVSIRVVYRLFKWSFALRIWIFAAKVTQGTLGHFGGTEALV